VVGRQDLVHEFNLHSQPEHMMHRQMLINSLDPFRFFPPLRAASTKSTATAADCRHCAGYSRREAGLRFLDE